MSTPVAAVICTVLAVYVLLAVRVWRCEKRRPSERDRIVREAHEHADATHEADDLEFLYRLPAYDPAGEAGYEQLRQAIRDEQQKGEQ